MYWDWWHHSALVEKLFVFLLAVTSIIVVIRAARALVALHAIRRTVWANLVDRTVALQNVEAAAIGIANLVQTVFYLFMTVLFLLCIGEVRQISYSFDLPTQRLVEEAVGGVSVFGGVCVGTILVLHLIGLFTQARVRTASVGTSSGEHRAK
jgi:hypothetical protein